MKNIESIFEKDSGFDQKNITLKCTNIVPDHFLKAIEAGVTSEELEDFSRAGLKIFNRDPPRRYRRKQAPKDQRENSLRWIQLQAQLK